jgi:hypothetical protein
LIPDIFKPLLVPLASLTPYPRNAQRHPPEDVEKFRGVLRKFGWTNPIVAWGKNGTTYISAGHLRYLAATAEGLTEVPVLVRSDWTEAEFRAYTLADNQWTKRAAYDVALLREELVDLDTGEFDLTLTGFEKNEVYAMVHGGDAEFPELRNGPKPEFQQMTFTLHDSQVPVIQEALRAAKAAGDFTGPNENSNGNALARVAEAYGRS